MSTTRGCGPLYDQMCAYMDGDGPLPDFIVGLALDRVASAFTDGDDDGALAGHDH
jgi:hypothetical protein